MDYKFKPVREKKTFQLYTNHWNWQKYYTFASRKNDSTPIGSIIISSVYCTTIVCYANTSLVVCSSNEFMHIHYTYKDWRFLWLYLSQNLKVWKVDLSQSSIE